MRWQSEQSINRMSAYRREPVDDGEVALAATMKRARFPISTPPTLEAVREVRAEWEPRLESAIDDGDGSAARIAYWHAGWARKTERALLDGTTPAFREGRIHAVRVGDGVIVSGPGEVFTEIGMAVKERSPGRPTMYLGFTNGLVAYFATAVEYGYGGYEADLSCRGHGLPAHVAPECEQILVETGVRAAEELFPHAPRWPQQSGWTASGTLPDPLLPDRLDHPSASRE
jgi:hypothetical protein